MSVKGKRRSVDERDGEKQKRQGTTVLLYQEENPVRVKVLCLLMVL
jgi:hypothetical protein